MFVTDPIHSTDITAGLRIDTHYIFLYIKGSIGTRPTEIIGHLFGAVTQR